MKRSRTPLTDPTIPRKGPRLGNAKERQRTDPTWARLVDYGDRLVMMDSRGNAIPCDASKVRYLAGPFGNRLEGVYAAPRPWKFQGDRAVVEGDQFLVVFLDGDPAKPVLIGGVQHTRPDDPDTLPPNQIGEDPNPRRVRMGAINDAGIVTGHVEIRALDGGTAFEVVVGGASFGTGTRIRIDHGEGTIRIGQGAEDQRVALGDAVVEAIKGLADDIVALNLAHTGPTTAPVPELNATAITLDAASSLAGPGAPFLSQIAKVE